MNNHGQRIRFIRGTYEDQKGWLNANREPTKCKYYVIVEANPPDRVHEKETFVLKTSVKFINVQNEPTTWEEALLNQHPDIDRQMDKLAADLVMCRFDYQQSGEEISRILVEKIADEQNKVQALGSNAKYKDVIWETNVDLD
jgi:hypothetical protein